MYCPICKRKVVQEHNRRQSEAMVSEPVGVYYTHDYYGCDTGCCGHSIYVLLANGNVTERDFDFTHNQEGIEEDVRDLAHHLGVPVLTEMCEFFDNC